MATQKTRNLFSIASAHTHTHRNTHCLQACSLHRFLHFPVGAFAQSLHHLVAVFEVVFMLVLLDCRTGCWSLGVRRLLLLVPAAGSADRQLRGRLAIAVPAGRRVLQAAEFGVVAGAHRAAAVSFASSHPPSAAAMAPVWIPKIKFERRKKKTITKSQSGRSLAHRELFLKLESIRAADARSLICHPLTQTRRNRSTESPTVGSRLLPQGPSASHPFRIVLFFS